MYGLLLRLLALFLVACISLRGEVLQVPGKFASIKSAVAAAVGGDVIEVDDGYYFEGNIVLDKAITIRAKNAFQAVIHGEVQSHFRNAIFIVRAAVAIEGFILKNGACGILQRGSPDVAWSAGNLAVLNMGEEAISIDAAQGNFGRGVFSGIIIDNCRTGFSTNDAHSMEVSHCLVANCPIAFASYDHISFQVEKAMVWNCQRIFLENEDHLLYPKTNAITRGSDIDVLDARNVPRSVPGQTVALPKDFFPVAWASLQGKVAATTGQGLALAIAGDVYFRLNEYGRSIQLNQGALRLGERAGSDEVIWRAHTGLALALEKQGQDKDSLEHFRRAALLLEGFRQKLPLRAFNPGFFRDKSWVYVAAIRHLAEMYKKESLPAYVEEAFAFAEMSKARGFLDSLEEASLDFSPTTNPEVVAEGQRLSSEVSRCMIELQTHELSPSKRAELLIQLGKVENAYRDLLIRTRREEPAIADRLYPGTLALEEVRSRLLPEGTALVEFVLGEECSFAFWATRDSLDLSTLPPSAQLHALVLNYLKFLALKDPREFLAKEGSCRLFEVLLGSFRNRLGGGVQRIIIIPDAHLYYLPFESLMVRGGNGQASRFLIEDCEVSYAPSASALVRLMGRDRYRIPRKSLLAISAPKPPFLINYLFGYPIKLQELKYARREIEAISRLFESDQRTILEGTQADETNLKRLPLGDYRFIHFAAHGIFDDQNWRWSGLLLWRGKGSAEDGVLQLRDIYLLDFCSDLVVLSACQTGKGEIETGEGIVGLTAGFLFAGSRAVLVSLWNIDDRSTAMFMGSFYKHLLEGASVSRALQNVKVEMIRSSYKHPYYWAGFSLIGDTGPYSISK